MPKIEFCIKLTFSHVELPRAFLCLKILKQDWPLQN